MSELAFLARKAAADLLEETARAVIVLAGGEPARTFRYEVRPDAEGHGAIGQGLKRVANASGVMVTVGLKFGLLT